MERAGLWIITALASLASIALHDHLRRTHLDLPKFLAPPPENIEYFSFGFRESMADSLWLRWIQDSDVCQTYLKEERKVQPTKPLTEDPLLSNQEHRVCDNSWGFLMLDAVTKLAPRFEMAYLAGGSLLAVELEDYAGATVIFDRGIKEYPGDWRMLYRGAYHFLYDTHDLSKAAKLLEQASQEGAPSWLRSLAARIYSEAGQYELGITALESYRPLVKDAKMREKIDRRIAELKAKAAKAP